MNISPETLCYAIASDFLGTNLMAIRNGCSRTAGLDRFREVNLLMRAYPASNATKFNCGIYTTSCATEGFRSSNCKRIGDLQVEIRSFIPSPTCLSFEFRTLLTWRKDGMGVYFTFVGSLKSDAYSAFNLINNCERLG